MYSERTKANADIREKETKEFNDLLKGAADAAAPVAQRVPLIWALHRYWDSEHELVLANALSALVANDKDRAVMESAAEVIGHAYERNTAGLAETIDAGDDSDMSLLIGRRFQQHFEVT